MPQKEVSKKSSITFFGPPGSLRILIEAIVCLENIEKGGKGPHPQDFGLTKKTARFTKGQFSSLLRTENGLTTDIFVVKCTGRGLVVKRLGVLSKVQTLNLVLGVGVFSPLPKKIIF